ncbi:hypothetical protein GCM10025776_13960 [Corallincola platygyrae]
MPFTGISPSRAFIYLIAKQANGTAAQGDTTSKIQKLNSPECWTVSPTMELLNFAALKFHFFGFYH